jgi:peptidoglycan/LPS O-acetylase OafA/YrhL
MKHSDIELAGISRFRGELMGLAMLFVILFHVSLSRDDPFYGLRRCGNVGVDMFLFLSGVGLWFAWTKQPSVRTFYRRRLLRILPTWLLVAGAFYGADFLGPRRFSRSVIDLIGDVTVNWDFWLHDELTFWYVPAILMLYLLAPHYMRLITRHPVYRWLPLLMVVWCVMVQWVTPIHRAVGHIEIFWSRVPIFFIGINMGHSVKQQRTLEGSAVWLLLLSFAMTFGTSLYLEQMRHGQFPLFVERMIYIPLTITGILLLNRVLSRMPQWVNRSLRFVGMISLEVYLLHVQFVLLHVERLHLGYWPTFLLTVAITLPVAWLLQKTINYAIQKIK